MISHFEYKLSKHRYVRWEGFVEFLMLNLVDSIVSHDVFSFDQAKTLCKIDNRTIQFGDDPEVIEIFHELSLGIGSLRVHLLRVYIWFIFEKKFWELLDRKNILVLPRKPNDLFIVFVNNLFLCEALRGSISKIKIFFLWKKHLKVSILVFIVGSFK